MLLYGEKGKTNFLRKVKQFIFLESIVVYDIKVSQLNAYMKLYDYQRSRPFIGLGPNHSD